MYMMMLRKILINFQYMQNCRACRAVQPQVYQPTSAHDQGSIVLLCIACSRAVYIVLGLLSCFAQLVGLYSVRATAHQCTQSGIHCLALHSLQGCIVLGLQPTSAHNPGSIVLLCIACRAVQCQGYSPPVHTIRDPLSCFAQLVGLYSVSQGYSPTVHTIRDPLSCFAQLVGLYSVRATTAHQCTQSGIHCLALHMCVCLLFCIIITL